MSGFSAAACVAWVLFFLPCTASKAGPERWDPPSVQRGEVLIDTHNRKSPNPCERDRAGRGWPGHHTPGSMPMVKRRAHPCGHTRTSVSKFAAWLDWSGTHERRHGPSGGPHARSTAASAAPLDGMLVPIDDVACACAGGDPRARKSPIAVTVATNDPPACPAYPPGSVAAACTADYACTIFPMKT